MKEISAREKCMEAQLLSIISDLGLEPSVPFVEILNRIFALQYPWIDVDGIKNMPFGNWVVLMADGQYGVCEVCMGGSGVFAVINGRFYFDYEPVVAYMPMPEYMPKGGA